MKIVYFKKSCNSNCGLTFLNLLKQVLKDLNIEADIKVLSGIDEASKYGVGDIPSLIINDQLVASGFYLTEKQLTKTLKKMNK